MSWPSKFRLKRMERMAGAKGRFQKANTRKRGDLRYGRGNVSVVACSSRTEKGPK